MASATSKNIHDQLAAQLLASKLNVANKAPVCDTVTKTIGYADTIQTNVGYQGPETTKVPTGQAKDYAVQLQTILDNYNNYGCQ